MYNYGNSGFGYNNYPQTNFYQNQMQMPTGNQLIRVTGLEGAKTYQMSPNSVVALFDSNNDIFYIKSTDGAGFPTIRSFSFVPYELEQKTNDYVTRNEYNALLEKVDALLQNKNEVVENA